MLHANSSVPGATAHVSGPLVHSRSSKVCAVYPTRRCATTQPPRNGAGAVRFFIDILLIREQLTNPEHQTPRAHQIQQSAHNQLRIVGAADIRLTRCARAPRTAPPPRTTAVSRHPPHVSPTRTSAPQRERHRPHHRSVHSRDMAFHSVVRRGPKLVPARPYRVPPIKPAIFSKSYVTFCDVFRVVVK